MPHKPTRIEMRIINTTPHGIATFPRFVIVDDRGRYWTSKGWSRKLRRALLFAYADLLRETIEMLKKNCP